MDAAEFLHVLFDDAAQADRRLAVWTLPDRATRFHADPDDAAEAAMQLSSDHDVYFGLGLIAGSPQGRGKLEDVAAITCLWADLDILDPAHKKKNLPPDLPAAMRLLDRVGLAASVVVHSGHGLQAYWLLKEPWIFDAPADRAKAARLAQRWSATIRALAAAEGYDLDAVGDLTRVFRVPGTMNRKGKQALPVRVLDAGLQRYAPDDFDVLLVAEEQEPGAKRAEAAVAAVALAAGAEPPATKFGALLSNDAKFRRTWNRSRTDMQDQSQSAYDMSLATIASSVAWTDQEIADLLIAHRRLHRQDVGKALRRDYVQRTIAKARAATASESEMARAASSDGSDRSGLLALLSKNLGIEVRRWIQHGTENARFSLVMGSGVQVPIGTSANAMTQKSFQVRLYEAAGVVVPTFKNQTWNNILTTLAKIREVIENEEGKAPALALEWVRAYLAKRPPIEGEEWKQAAAVGRPFLRDAKVYISTTDLMKHLKVHQMETVKRDELYEALRRAGFVQQQVNVDGAGKSVRRFWAADVARSALYTASETNEAPGGYK